MQQGACAMQTVGNVSDGVVSWRSSTDLRNVADSVLHLDNLLRLLDVLVFVGCHRHLAQSKLDLQSFCALYIQAQESRTRETAVG